MGGNDIPHGIGRRECDFALEPAPALLPRPLAQRLCPVSVSDWHANPGKIVRGRRGPWATSDALTTCRGIGRAPDLCKRLPEHTPSEDPRVMSETPHCTIQYNLLRHSPRLTQHVQREPILLVLLALVVAGGDAFFSRENGKLTDRCRRRPWRRRPTRHGCIRVRFL